MRQSRVVDLAARDVSVRHDASIVRERGDRQQLKVRVPVDRGGDRDGDLGRRLSGGRGDRELDPFDHQVDGARGGRACAEDAGFGQKETEGEEGIA